jgi:regulatory protein
MRNPPQNKPESGKGNARPAKKPPKRITDTYLRNYGLFYLGRFASSSGNFRRVLGRRIDASCRFHTEQDRAACAALLEAVIADFTRAGLLNDEAYARGLAHSLRRRGLSARAVLRKLGERGIPAAEARAALAAQDGEAGNSVNETSPDIAAALRTARRKRIGPFAAPARAPLAAGEADTARAAQKALAALARAGFDYDTCIRVMEMSREDAEEMLAGPWP